MSGFESNSLEGFGRAIAGEWDFDLAGGLGKLDKGRPPSLQEVWGAFNRLVGSVRDSG